MKPQVIIFLGLSFIVSQCSKNSTEEVPVTFTCDQCDYIISGYRTDGVELDIKPGQVICLDASVKYNNLVLSNIKGTAASPIIIRNCGGIAKLISTESFGLKFEYCENFKLLGDGTGENNYGIRISTRSGFYLTTEYFTTDFEIAQIEIAGLSKNGLGNDAGFAGMGIKTSPYQDCDLFRDATRKAWIMKNVSIHDNFVHDTGGEGMYIGHGFYKGRKEADCTDTTYSHSIQGLRVYNNRIANTGFDGLQIKNADKDCEIYNNVILNYGTLGENGQNEGLFLGEGVTGKVYNNFVNFGTGNGLRFQGMGNNDIFNNVIMNSGRDGFNAAGSQYSVYIPGGYFKIFNNTIYNSKEAGLVFFTTNGGVKHIINNLVVGAAELNPKGAEVLSTYNLFTQNSGEVKFVNAAKGDLRVNNGSTAIDAGFDVRILMPELTFDCLNNARPKGTGFDIGAYEHE
jgi:hypothetical protein